MYQVNKGDWPHGRYTRKETHNLMGSWLKVEYLPFNLSEYDVVVALKIWASLYIPSYGVQSILLT